ncbi:hypothetical protein AnigIFM63604_006335 [Aspergillus niger]|uniref:Contig An12c0060, genomic contig n=2 Tax=Aspergillus niger TaxID=5061 RepID=A2QYM2_ASPNC|nr:uncharacterized protein An12g01750 [Aspergillus niger]GLA50287.1 hypothetical protein AnigIFM63604_006335 [Aspergillus niger]CAK48457.1 unnamed protein product [Aspergillus niger]
MVFSLTNVNISAPQEEYDDEGENTTEKAGLLRSESYQPPFENPRRRLNYCASVLLFSNICLATLLFVAVHLLQKQYSLLTGPDPPYSLENDNGFKIANETAKKHGLPKSVELYRDPGYLIYGLGVYHQLHCLNRLRKSFYPDIFYPNMSTEQIEIHKSSYKHAANTISYTTNSYSDHCFDAIRQAILCHGDISLIYWWDPNYTYIDDDGIERYTEDYLKKSPRERQVGLHASWSSEVQCRDMDAINSWVKERMVDPDKYGGREVD